MESRVLDFATWAQCFAIYMVAIVQKLPLKAPDLMSYMVEIANNAKTYTLVLMANLQSKLLTTHGEQKRSSLGKNKSQNSFRMLY